jgi:ankyrin repeat protein
MTRSGAIPSLLLRWSIAAFLFTGVAYGQMVDVTRPQQANQLIYAASFGDLGTVESKIKEGADLEAVDTIGRTALMYAAQFGHLKLVKVLIAAGARVNAAEKSENENTALSLATHNNHCEVVQFLIASGADVNQRIGSGHTALFEFGSPCVLRALLKAGADVNAQDKYGQTALMGCALTYSEESVEILIRAGANVNLARDDGHTALTLAFTILPILAETRSGESRNLGLIKNLVRAGADVNARTKNGDTPLSLARQYKLKKVAKILLEAGATK